MRIRSNKAVVTLTKNNGNKIDFHIPYLVTPGFLAFHI